MFALQMNIFKLTDQTNNTHKEERTILMNRLLSIIDQTKKDLKMSRWIHMPHASEEYKYYKILCGTLEAFAHMQFATSLDMGSLDGSDDSNKVAVGHLKKARAIYNLFGMKNEAQNIDTAIVSMFTSSKQATNTRMQIALGCKT